MIWPWLMAFGLPFPLLALRAGRNYRRLARLAPGVPDGADLPPLSIIVPARNEAENLRLLLLPSLDLQAYPGKLEVVVVDDASTDATAAVAEEFGVCVIPAGELPAGWQGKPHACHKGAHAAGGEWLLFTDADTEHVPGSAAAAVHHAVQNDLHGLSLLLDDTGGGLPDRLAFMTAYSGLFAGHRNRQPLLNGQYILLRRDIYFESGGFAAVRGEALEDLALAHRLWDHGARVPLLRGEALARVAPYAGQLHLWKALVRLGAGALKWSGAGGWLTALYITGALLPALGLFFVVFLGMPAWLLGASWLGVAVFSLPWARRYGGWPLALLAPLGALLVQASAVTGLVRSFAGLGISWKGRLV